MSGLVGKRHMRDWAVGMAYGNGCVDNGKVFE